MQLDALPRSPVEFLARYIRRHAFLHGIILIAVLAAVACSIGTRYSMKYLVDAIALGPEAIAAVWMTLLLFTSLVGGDFLLWRLGGWAAARAFPRVGVDLRLDLFKHLLAQPVRYFADRFSGALAGRVSAAAEAVYTIENSLAWNVLPPAAAILGAVLSLVLIEWHMAVALTAAVAVMGVALGMAAARGQPRHRHYATRAAEVAGQVVDVVTNHSTVRSFGAAPREYARLGTCLAGEMTAHVRALSYMERLRVIHAVCVWVLTGAILAWAVLVWQVGGLTAGEVVVIGSLALVLLQASRDLAVALVEMAHHWSRLAEALDVLTAPAEPVQQPGAAPVVCQRGGVDFEGVSFAYSNDRAVLDKVDLAIAPGEKVGLVGASGAGKTTLLSLVQGLVPASEGRILIDGHDVTQVAPESLRKAIALVPQDVSLFHRSILENIRYGRPDATDEEVMAAARAARCDEFIRDLPEGYDTMVGERGARLSGGQRQRIGIARALLVDAPILLLDEATSALDARSEAAVQAALAELMRGRTVLAATHRLSTIASFDRVIVLENGRIVEDGAPEALARGDGLFGRLWRLQMGEQPPPIVLADRVARWRGDRRHRPSFAAASANRTGTA